MVAGGSAVALDFGGTARGPGETGRAHIEVFRTGDHPGGPQNWAIVQDRRGLIYVGNNIGVLEFDGVRWRLIDVSNQSTVRSLTVANDGRVYVGAHNEFGYLAPDAHGRLQYVSMLMRLPPEQRNIGAVMGVFETPLGMVFVSRSMLVRIGADRVERFAADTAFGLPFAVDGEVHLHQPGKGLLHLNENGLALMPGSAAFADRAVHVLLPMGDRARLVCARGTGCSRWQDGVVQPWPTLVDERLNNAVLYGGVRLQNGHFALATIRDGVYVLDASGQLVDVLDKARGLPENTTLSLKVDADSGLWLGMENHIVRLRYPDDLSFFGPRDGLEGTVVSLHRHRGVLYAGTGFGLMRLRTDPLAPPRFEAVPGAEGQTWQMISWDDQLIIANASGVMALDGDGITSMIRRSSGHSMALSRSKLNPDRLYIGLQDGIATVRRSTSGWVEEGTAPGVLGSVRSVAEDGDRLWLAPQSADVALTALPPSWLGSPPARPKLTFFGQDKGLPVLTNQFLSRLQAGVRLTTLAGIRRFNSQQQRFELDPALNVMFDDPEKPGWVYNLIEDSAGRIWTSTEAGRGVLLPRPEGGYRWAGEAMLPILWPTSAIHIDADGTSWWGGAEGLVRLANAAIDVAPQTPNATIRNVTAADVVVYGGAGTLAPPALTHDRNALRFEFASTSYQFMADRRFQTRLKGLDQDWSPWSSETYRDYTNLPAGQFSFLVRVRDVYGRISEPAAWSFEVMAPWYRTFWAYLAYLLLFCLAARQLWRLRTRRLKERNRELAALVEARTAELEKKHTELQAAYRGVQEASSTDVLTGLRNRRYVAEMMAADVAQTLSACAAAGGDPPESVDHVFFLLDLDHFKEVNDHYGHAAGDQVLVQCASVLREVFRESDCLVRWGGEEFLAIARFTSRRTAAELAERLRARFERELIDLGNGRSVQRTCSIGFACFPFLRSAPAALQWQRVVDVADHALYAAKQTRNAWVGVLADDTATAAVLNGVGDLRGLLKQAGIQLLRSRTVQSSITPAQQQK